MRQISSEPKFENFSSPTLKNKSSFSISESNLKGKEKYCILDNAKTSWSIDSDSEDEQKLSTISENVEFGEEDGIQTTIVPPDGGWGWVVCFACFMGNFICDGIVYVAGVMIGYWADYFEANLAAVAFIGSIMNGIAFGNGPIVACLIKKFGSRSVCIAGSLIATFGILVSMISPNVYMLVITYGVIGGIGISLVYVPTMVSPSHYFTTKRALATGISMSGSCLGAFVLAPVSSYLSENHGWKATVGLYAGLMSILVIEGILFRPLKDVGIPKNFTEKESLNSNFDANEKNSPAVDSSKYNDIMEKEERTNELSLVPKLKNLSSPESQSYYSIKSPINDGFKKNSIKDESHENFYSICNTARTEEFQSCDEQKLTVEYSKPRIILSNSNTGLYMPPSLSNISEIHDNSKKEIPCQENSYQEIDIEPDEDGTTDLTTWQSVKNAMEFHWMSNSVFLLFCSMGILAQLALYIPYSYLPQLSMKSGLDDISASTLISIMSLSNMVGRISVGVVIDRFHINIILFHNTSFLFCAVSMVSFLLCQSYISYVLCSVFYGFATAIYVSQSTVILVELFGIDGLNGTFGLLSLFKGIATTFSAPISGLLYDITQNYVASFTSGSVLFILCCIIGFQMQIMYKKTNM